MLSGDACLERGLGYGPPKATAVREFLERFHDPELEKLRPERAVQKSFIFPASARVPACHAALRIVSRGWYKLTKTKSAPESRTAWR